MGEKWNDAWKLPPVQTNENDSDVLAIKFSHSPRFGDVGIIVKIFRMPTDSWHDFPEKKHTLSRTGVSQVAVMKKGGWEEPLLL